MIEIDVAPSPSQLRNVRGALRVGLEETRLENEHIEGILAVATELLGVALEGRVKGHLVLSVDTFTLLTSVRVHCPTQVQLRDEPFGIRDRVLGGFAFAWGKRQHVDGSVDLWAELAKRVPLATSRVIGR